MANPQGEGVAVGGGIPGREVFTGEVPSPRTSGEYLTDLEKAINTGDTYQACMAAAEQIGAQPLTEDDLTAFRTAGGVFTILSPNDVAQHVLSVHAAKQGIKPSKDQRAEDSISELQAELFGGDPLKVSRARSILMGYASGPESIAATLASQAGRVMRSPSTETKVGLRGYRPAIAVEHALVVQPDGTLIALRATNEMPKPNGDGTQTQSSITELERIVQTRNIQPWNTESPNPGAFSAAITAASSLGAKGQAHAPAQHRWITPSVGKYAKLSAAVSARTSLQEHTIDGQHPGSVTVQRDRAMVRTRTHATPASLEANASWATDGRVPLHMIRVAEGLQAARDLLRLPRRNDALLNVAAQEVLSTQLHELAESGRTSVGTGQLSVDGLKEYIAAHRESTTGRNLGMLVMIGAMSRNSWLSPIARTGGISNRDARELTQSLFNSSREPAPEAVKSVLTLGRGITGLSRKYQKATLSDIEELLRDPSRSKADLLMTTVKRR